MIVRKKDYKNAYFNGNPMTKKIQGVGGGPPDPCFGTKGKMEIPQKNKLAFSRCVQRCNYNAPPPRSGLFSKNP